MIKSRLVLELQWWIGRLLSSEGVASEILKIHISSTTSMLQQTLYQSRPTLHSTSIARTQETGSAISAIGRLFDGFYPLPHASNSVTCLGAS